jgi:2-oxoisovalerate dehydrogenase E2 component (dihydrolipoyl transacylase)
MGHYTFRLPDVGEGVAEAEIVAWHVEVGDRVEEDQSTVDVMTDKATVEMSAPVAGRVLAVHGEIGMRVPVGSPLIELEIDGDTGSTAQQEALPRPLPPSAAAMPAAMPPAPVQAKPAAAPACAPARRLPGDNPLAAPATRRRAYELGIPLQFVPGTGPGGRITADDLNAYLARSDRPVAARAEPDKRTGITETRIIGLRRTIAQKMQEAKRRIPHFTYVEEFDLTELEGLRRTLNDDRQGDQPKLTLLPFFVQALVRLIPAFPQVNARYDDEAGILNVHDGIHVGIATQTPDGLMVPVIRHAEARTLWDYARELTRVTTAAREKKATRDELTGSTITLTSLGALGGIAATPVINHPEVAIIGPNKLVERAVVRDGQVAIRTMMNLSASFDHRIVDGYDAARFIQAMKQLIEHPALLFLDRP